MPKESTGKNKNNSNNINWYPGHMAKAIKEIENDLKIIDVVIELLDARIPISSRNPDIQKLIKNKKRIIILNKSDLADDKLTAIWQERLSKEAPCLITDANSGKGIDKVSKKIDELMEEEKARQAAKGRINKTIRVMIVGIPNVGKSSFINRMAKKSSLVVANRPGVTVSKQWIRIGKNQELLDTAGVLWPKFEDEEISLNLAFTGTIKDNLLESTEIAYQFLNKIINNYESFILDRYKISNEEYNKTKQSQNPIYELMKLIGVKRGAIGSGGKIDEEKTSNIILDDFRSGKLGKITLEK